MPHAMPSSALKIHHSHDNRPPDTSWQAGPKTPTGGRLLAAGCHARARACMRHAAAGLSATGLSADSDTDSVMCRAQHSSKCAHSLLCMLSFTPAVLSTAATAPSFTHMPCSAHRQVHGTPSQRVRVLAHCMHRTGCKVHFCVIADRSVRACITSVPTRRHLQQPHHTRTAGQVYSQQAPAHLANTTQLC